MRLVPWFGFTFGPLLVLGTACADDTRQAAATDEDYANVAASIGITAAHDGDEVSAMRAAAALARGDMPSGLALGADGAYRGHSAGIDFRYALACHAAGTAGQAATAVAPCNPSTTGADVTASWSGGLELPSLAMTISHDAAWTLTGISRSLAHVDGTGHLSYDTSDDASSYHYRYDATYHVVVDDQRAIGGDIVFAIAAQRTAGQASQRFTIDAELTFAPDDTAELVLDGTRHYQIALATGVTTRSDGAAPTTGTI